MITSELRIGNKLLHQNKVITIEGIQPTYVWSDFQVGNIHALRLGRIILTDEWLINFGFEKYSKDFDYKKDFIHLGYITSDKCFQFEAGSLIVDIHYVHQLQNLYFALTGTELELTNN